MNIRALKPTEWPAYDDLARLHGTLFNRLDWVQLFGARMKIFGLFDAGESLIGGLSMYGDRRWGLTFLRRPPFTPTCGPFFAPKAQNPVAIVEERRKVLEAMAGQVLRDNPAVCMLSLDRRIRDALPFLWRGFKVVPNYTYLLDLSREPDDLLRRMSPERRKNLTKAAKDGLEVRIEPDLHGVRDLVLGTFRRQGKAVDEPALDAVLFHYARPENSYAFSTCREGRTIASVFVVHDESTAYYLMGGYRESGRHHGAGAAAMWAAIRHAQSLGLKTFDFEGSILPAIERYFRGFGGDVVPYYTVNRAWWPVETALKCIRRSVF